MRIGVLLASSQAAKSEMLYRAVLKYATGAEVICYGCWPESTEQYSYIETSLLAGLLLMSGGVDFVVTGCSSGQGMMLACNSFSGVLCGYVPTPRDAFLFAQINNGNAVSMPLGEGYTWAGSKNMEQTIEALFSEPFGQGYPKNEADRKLRDTARLRELRNLSQVSVTQFLDRRDAPFRRKLLSKHDVMDDILKSGHSDSLRCWLTGHMGTIS